MALVHPQSMESTDTGLDLFLLPPTQTAAMEGITTEVFPLSSLSKGAPIEFIITGEGDEYLDLKNTLLQIKAKVTKEDGTDLENNTAVAPCNNYLHSLFQQVDVYFNSVLISTSDNAYPYRAYLANTFGSTRNRKMGALTSEGYFIDTAGKMDTVAGNTNKGWDHRKDIAEKSKEIDMMGPLKLDITEQSKYILPGVTVRIRLTPSKSAFNLMAAADQGKFQSLITHASLHVRKIKVNPAVSVAHEKVLEKQTAKYPLKRVVQKIFNIPQGAFSHVQDNLYLSQTPTQLFIMLVDTEGFNGGYPHNPFRFHHHDLSYFSLRVNGKDVGGKPLTPDFTNGQYARTYSTLMDALGLIHSGELGISLSYEDFPLGFCVVGFDLSPSRVDGFRTELVKSGPLRVEMKFQKPLSNPINAICVGVMDSVIEIDKTRQILKDF